MEESEAHALYLELQKSDRGAKTKQVTTALRAAPPTGVS
jgi:hypothetical protein